MSHDEISPKDPYWPCIIYSPAIAPPKNLAYKKWMGMSEVKQSNNYIVYWFGYNMQFSCISKNKIISFKENEDEMVKTKGGKKKLSAKMQELFDASIVEAKSELEKAKAARTAFLASRTNTMLSIPMLMSMVGAGHGFFI